MFNKTQLLQPLPSSFYKHESEIEILSSDIVLVESVEYITRTWIVRNSKIITT